MNPTEEIIAYPTPDKKTVAERLARSISLVFHPFLMPLYGVAILLFGNTFMAYLPVRMKYYVLGVVALTTLIFPALSIALLKNLKVISGLSLESRRDRMWPLLVVCIGYMLCAWMLSGYAAIGLLHRVIYAAVVSILICFAVNLRWKISLHMTAMGAIVAMLFCVTLRNYGALFTPLLISVASAGLLGAARLYLGYHSSWQILAGFGVGVLVMSLAVLL